MVANLEYILQQIDRMGRPPEIEEDDDDEGEMMRELIDALTDMSGRIETALGNEVDTSKIEAAINSLAKAMNVTVKPPQVSVSPPAVTVAAPTVNVKAPTVNVAAPNVEVLMPDKETMTRFDIYRDERGLLKTVVAVTIEKYDDDDKFDID